MGRGREAVAAILQKAIQHETAGNNVIATQVIESQSPLDALFASTGDVTILQAYLDKLDSSEAQQFAQEVEEFLLQRYPEKDYPQFYQDGAPITSHDGK